MLNNSLFGIRRQSIVAVFFVCNWKVTLSGTINETCAAILWALKDTYVRSSGAPEVWKTIAKEFQEIQNLPHRIDVIDGKHVAIKLPLNSGSLYFNYKGYFSIILMTICDACYVFTHIDIVGYVSNNGSDAFRNSQIGEQSFKNKVHLPTAKSL